MIETIEELLRLRNYQNTAIRINNKKEKKNRLTACKSTRRKGISLILVQLFFFRNSNIK